MVNIRCFISNSKRQVGAVVHRSITQNIKSVIPKTLFHSFIFFLLGNVSLILYRGTMRLFFLVRKYGSTILVLTNLYIIFHETHGDLCLLNFIRRSSSCKLSFSSLIFHSLEKCTLVKPKRLSFCTMTLVS